MKNSVGLGFNSYRAAACMGLLTVPKGQWIKSDEIINMVNSCWFIKNRREFKKLSRKGLTKLEHAVWSILQSYTDEGKIQYRKQEDNKINGYYYIPRNVDFTTKVEVNL